MELSVYDLLGINSNSSFRLVKNAYHDLARIYHPDSTNVMKGLTKEDRITAFKRIQTAYDNIKKKMNVVEIDMPESEMIYEMIYEIPIISRTDIFDNKEISEFNRNRLLEYSKTGAKAIGFAAKYVSKGALEIGKVVLEGAKLTWDAAWDMWYSMWGANREYREKYPDQDRI